jgi:hypothetical protein
MWPKRSAKLEGVTDGYDGLKGYMQSPPPLLRIGHFNARLDMLNVEETIEHALRDRLRQICNAVDRRDVEKILSSPRFVDKEAVNFKAASARQVSQKVDHSRERRGRTL